MAQQSRRNFQLDLFFDQAALKQAIFIPMKAIRKYADFIALGLLVIGANLFVSSPMLVETFYTRVFYSFISSSSRAFLGWIPFSIGDIVYIFIILFLLSRLIRFFRRKSPGQPQWPMIRHRILKVILAIVWVWLIFQSLWGFNYYRENLGVQFDLADKAPTPMDLNRLATYFLEETNAFAEGRSTLKFNKEKELKVLSQAYDSMARQYSFLAYSNPSFKTSLFGVLGNYMGVGGYYNPFSGEAQVNDRLPVFLLPFTSAHEVAHQLGYAKESDANFIGYLASIHSADSSLKYSANLEMFLYTNAALKKYDSVASKKLYDSLGSIASHDLKIYKSYIQKYQGPIDEFTTRFYTQFLHLNNQPEGMQSYSRVVYWLFNYWDKNKLGNREEAIDKGK